MSFQFFSSKLPTRETVVRGIIPVVLTGSAAAVGGAIGMLLAFSFCNPTGIAGPLGQVTNTTAPPAPSCGRLELGFGVSFAAGFALAMALYLFIRNCCDTTQANVTVESPAHETTPFAHL